MSIGPSDINLEPNVGTHHLGSRVYNFHLVPCLSDALEVVTIKKRDKGERSRWPNVVAPSKYFAYLMGVFC